jgi:hypothetical protein
MVSACEADTAGQKWNQQLICILLLFTLVPCTLNVPWYQEFISVQQKQISWNRFFKCYLGIRHGTFF